MAFGKAQLLGPTLTPPRTGDAGELLDRAMKAEREGYRAAARQLYEQVMWAAPATLTPDRCSGALLGAARTYQSDGQSEAALDCLDAAEAVATINRADA